MKIHFEVMEVTATSLCLVVPALFATTKTGLLIYYSCAYGDCLWLNLRRLSCFVPVREWIVFGAGFRATVSALS